MGFDPAYRTGCKIAVVDETGKVLETGVVYPTPPHNRKDEARKTLTAMIRRHGVTAIAIGNGTASKESEIFIADMIRDLPGVAYMVVNEAGASVYSASKLGAEEFPDYDVSLRSAVSIARRLQDPLAELVKIEPKSIGVGQYQHDMPPARLDETLRGVVEDCVNSVGADLNTASAPLLSYVAGLNDTAAKNIVAYREANGAYPSRAALKKVPRIGPKAFEQCAGFLRVMQGKNVLDATGVHPESYAAAEKLLALCGYTEDDVRAHRVGELRERVKALGEEKAAAHCGVGVPTLSDIVSDLMKPGRDPRDELPAPLLRTDILELKDLEARHEAARHGAQCCGLRRVRRYRRASGRPCAYIPPFGQLCAKALGRRPRGRRGGCCRRRGGRGEKAHRAFNARCRRWQKLTEKSQNCNLPERPAARILDLHKKHFFHLCKS